MDSEVQKLLEKFKERLTLDGRKKIFEDEYKLSSDFLVQKSDPEAFTKEFLIEPIINKFELSKLPEKHFKGIKGELRKVDYLLKNQKNVSFLAEAKPLNSDLFERGPNGAVNQIKGLFRLAEVKENYKFGLATDGLKWIFIDKYSKVVFQLELTKDLGKIKEILVGKEEVSSEKMGEEISKKFYEWYNALLHGGKYKDHDNRVRKISTKDCLVENILFVSNPEEREYIAQTIIDRLIFTKFLQSKSIVGYDILNYLLKLDENILNEKLKQLFFSVLNTKKNERADIDQKFKDIPYLNGSLFVRTELELRNPDYKIKAFILKEVIKFLDSFRFVHTEGASNQQMLDPEILGYIFERAMTATDRKGTGAYYTPKTITNFISERAIHPVIIKRVNKLLKEKGYRDSEFLKNLEQVYSLRESTLGEVFSQVILNLKICDNACGSGAFLLAVADVLLEVYSRINEELRLKNSEIAMRKLILKNNLYGVDINPNAIEIAKLRLWLWLVSAYEPDKVEPLPNIDYNIRIGNSVIGYANISKFKEHKLTLLDWYSAEKSLNLMLKKREETITKYKDAVGGNARELKAEIDELDRKIKKLLDINLFQEINKKIKIDEKEFRETNPFHWGFEFYDVFDGNGENGNKGFDAVIGNPPYGNILKDVEKNSIFNFKTKNASEIAANFIERTLEIVETNGFIGLIVANSIAINKSTSSARDLIRKYMTKSKMALFGTRPAKIFADAEIRVLIFLGEKDRPEQVGIIYTTDAIKFTQEQKSTLLDNLSFESTDGLTLGKEKIGDNIEDVSLPKVGHSIIRSILLRLKEDSEIVIKERINKKGFKEKMEFRKTGGYWLNALEKMPYKSTKIEEVRFEHLVERDFCILVINSSLFYLYWSTYGNLRDFPLSLLEKFPFPRFDILNRNKRTIESLKDKISKSLLNSFLPDTGRVGEFRTAKCKNVIDEIDDFIGEIYNLNKKEIEFVKQYDKHIRKI